MNSSALESRDHGLEITTLIFWKEDEKENNEYSFSAENGKGRK